MQQLCQERLRNPYYQKLAYIVYCRIDSSARSVNSKFLRNDRFRVLKSFGVYTYTITTLVVNDIMRCNWQVFGRKMHVSQPFLGEFGTPLQHNNYIACDLRVEFNIDNKRVI